MKKIIISLLLVFAVVMAAVAAPHRFLPLTVTQPDGEVLNIFASGDEFNNYLHDKDGYSIMKNPNTGVYEYCVKQGNEPVASGMRVGTINPSSLGVEKHIRMSPEKVEQIVHSFRNDPNNAPIDIQPAPTTGTINNLVVFIRFSGESEFTQNISYYDDMFNKTTAGYNSMKNYYTEVSYNQLTVNTTFYPSTTTTVVSYQDTNTRGYYQPYDASTNTIGYTGGDSGTMRRDREHTLLVNAINAVKSQIPAGTNLDGDNDGKVDNVCFIIKGAPTGWSSLLWPHQWSLYSQTVNINTGSGDKRVYTFNFQLETSLNTSGVGVLCHEMFHSLGAPDLYHYSNQTPFVDMTPVGPWDVMEWNANPPQHMTMFMKMKYGKWFSSIPEITSTGSYTINVNTSSTNNVYKIASPFSASQYFVVELRKKAAAGSFESSLPGSGLIVYRINPAYSGNANSKDEVYVYRPNGTYTADGNISTQSWYHQSASRTAINDTTNPSSWLANYVDPATPATWTMDAGGLNISNINVASDGLSATFTVTFSGVYPPTLSAPANLATLIPTTTSFSWQTSATADKYTLQYSTSESFPADSSTVTVDNITTTSHTPAAPLANGTRYFWRVRSVKNAGDTSDWSAVWSFSTPYAAPIALPVNEDFQSYFPGIGWNSTGSAADRRWAHYGTTTKSMKADFWNWQSGYCEYITPGMDLSGYTNAELAFKWSHLHYIENGTHYNDTFEILTSTNGTTWSVAWSKTGSDFNSGDGAGSQTPGSFVSATVDLSSLAGQSTVYVKFKGTSGYGGSLFVDDIAVTGTISTPTVTVTSPNGTEQWKKNKTYTITWTDNFAENVKIELYRNTYPIVTPSPALKDGAVNAPATDRLTIIASTESDGSYSWTVPSNYNIASDYKIIISKVDDGTVIDESDAYFSIIAADVVTLTAPNGSESWKMNTTQTITWTDNFTENVAIELWKGGVKHSDITTSTESDGSYDWLIPSSLTVGSDYRIKIVQVGDTNTSDTSDADFSILAADPFITVTAPNGGERVLRGSNYAITWTDNISDNVKIELYKNGSFDSTIIASTESDGSYSWAVPSALTQASDYRLVITSVADAGVTDQSNANFRIDDSSIDAHIVANGAIWGYTSVYVVSELEIPTGWITMTIDSDSTSYGVDMIGTGGLNFRSVNAFNTYRFSDGAHTVYVRYNGVTAETLSLTAATIYPSSVVHFNGLALNIKEGNGGMMVVEGDVKISTCPISTTNKPFTIAFENASTKRIEIANPYGKKGALLRYDNNSWILVDHSVDNLVIRKAGTYVVVNDVNNVMIPVIRSNELAQNYPNPFNPSTEIPVKLVESSDIVLTVFDAKGREVIVLAEGRYEAGLTRIPWNGRDKRGNEVPSGVYYYRLTVNGKSFTKKMIMLK